MLTNLKLINLRLTKENMELTEMLRNNQSIQNTITSPCKSDILVSKTTNTFGKMNIYHKGLIKSETNKFVRFGFCFYNLFY